MPFSSNIFSLKLFVSHVICGFVLFLFVCFLGFFVSHVICVLSFFCVGHSFFFESYLLFFGYYLVLYEFKIDYTLDKFSAWISVGMSSNFQV